MMISLFPERATLSESGFTTGGLAQNSLTVSTHYNSLRVAEHSCSADETQSNALLKFNLLHIATTYYKSRNNLLSIKKNSNNIQLCTCLIQNIYLTDSS